MNNAVLKISSATVYCFQSCSPEFSRSSTQRSGLGARRLPSMIPAMYLLSGNASRMVKAMIENGRNHIPAPLEPFGPDQRGKEIYEQEQGNRCRHVDHIFSQPSRNRKHSNIPTSPKKNIAGNQKMRFMRSLSSSASEPADAGRLPSRLGLGEELARTEEISLPSLCWHANCHPDRVILET